MPEIIGLCPGEHTHDFYMLIKPGESLICPMCEERMVLYVATDLLLSGRVVADESEDGSPLLLDLATDPARVLA